MALKALLLKKQIDEMKSRMADLSQKTEELHIRESDLSSALDEAKSAEELRSVEGLINVFSEEQRAHQTEIDALQAEITAAEEALRSLESQQPKPAAPSPVTSSNLPPAVLDARKDDFTMSTKLTRAFGGMTPEQRSAFVHRDDIQEFLAQFRSMFKDGQTRSVSGAELTFPPAMLELLRQNVESVSKLLRYVRVVPVSGRTRQNIMGAIPEAVWTEMCAALNELYFSLNNVEVDGYKVGGYVAICNATLEDSDLNLLSELISGIGAAIGIAVDKSILFGLGKKMPLGIATRLKQTAQPDNYPETARPWQNLSASNVITIPSNTTGISLFQKMIQADSMAKSRYSRGSKFWAMNETTKTTILIEATSANAAGAIVSALDSTMPIVGGDIVVFSDDIMPDATIIGGYGDLYLMAERAGTSIGASDIPLFPQDQTVVKGTARYDGQPVIPEAFVAIGLGKAPTLEMPFAPDVANPSVAALRGLSIGSLSLSPSFDPEVDTYTAATSNASNMISAVPSTGSLATIKVNGKKVQNGGSITWENGENSVSITVTNGEKSKTYAVTVTKS